MTNILYPYKNVVYVDSGLRTSGSSSNFTIDLSNQVNNANNYDRIVMTSCSIPKSFYTIDTTNNTFTLTELGINYTVTLPIGNYSYSTVAVALKTALDSASGHGWIYSVSTSQLLGNLTFSVTANSGQPSFNFTSSRMAFIIGFDQDTYAFSANTLTSPNVVNLQLTSSIDVNSNWVAGKNNILSSISPDYASYAIISYNEQNPAFVSRELSGRSLTTVQFWLTDTQGNQLNLNGLNWSMVIVVYKLDDYHNQRLIEMRDTLVEDILKQKINELIEREK